MGTAYCWGQGVAADNRRALAAYKIGANGGHPAAQFQYGYALWDGESGRRRCGRYEAHPPLPLPGNGVKADKKQAEAWFEKSAAQNFPLAVGHLAALQSRVPTGSRQRARVLWQRAIALGDFAARNDLHIHDRQTPSVMLPSTRVTHAGLRSLCAPRSPRPPQVAPLMGKRVEIYATSREDLNGKRGVATDASMYQDDRADTRRYTVQVKCFHTKV